LLKGLLEKVSADGLQVVAEQIGQSEAGKRYFLLSGSYFALRNRRSEILLVVEQEGSFGGYTIPTCMRVGWHFGTERFEREEEFFRELLMRRFTGRRTVRSRLYAISDQGP
jgi:hypothetical protein